MVSRRAFLGVSLLVIGGRQVAATGAQGGLDIFAETAPPCGSEVTPTPGVPDDRSYKPGAPRRASLLEPGVSGARFVLTGTVAGIFCGRIKGATMDFWQADSRGAYDMAGFRLRGHQITDADGRYRLETVVPGAPAGRARHLGLRVSVPGRSGLWTELFFPDDPQNGRDARYRPALAMKTTRASDGQAATFDVILEL